MRPLTAEERPAVEGFLPSGKAPARPLTRARLAETVGVRPATGRTRYREGGKGRSFSSIL